MKAALRRVGLGLFVAIAAFGSLLLRGDGPAPDDADLLRTSAEVVAEHENGFTSLQAAGALLAWPEDEAESRRWSGLARGEAWDDARARELLGANERALEAFSRAARASAYRSPAAHDAESRALPDLLAWVRLARVSGVAAIAAARAGDRAEALEHALTSLRVARLMFDDENATLLHAAIAQNVGSAGLAALEVSVPQLAFDAASSRDAGARLAALRPDAAAQRAIWAAEYRALRQTALACCDAAQLAARMRAAGTPAFGALLPASYLYQPNNSLRAYAARIRLRQARADAPCLREPLEAEAIPRASVLLPNYLGRMAVAQSEQLAWFDARRCHYATHIEATRAAIALRAFETERGRLPPGVEALVPRYLESEPRDWFAAGALRLDRAARVVYSIGSDGRDDGGRATPGDEDFREPRFPLLGPGEAAASAATSQPASLRGLDLD